MIDVDEETEIEIMDLIQGAANETCMDAMTHGAYELYETISDDDDDDEKGDESFGNLDEVFELPIRKPLVFDQTLPELTRPRPRQMKKGRKYERLACPWRYSGSLSE